MNERAQRFGGLSDACVDRLQRDADRQVAVRALPGTIMTPVVVMLLTAVVGEGSPFWRAGLWFSASAIGLFVLRLWTIHRSKNVPDGAPGAPPRRAFEVASVASMALLAGYVGYGNYVLGVGLSSAVMIFAGASIMSGGLNVYAPNKPLMRVVVVTLSVGPLSGMLLNTSSMSWVLVVLMTLQGAYSFVLGSRIHDDYWQLAVARAQIAEGNRSMRVVLDTIDQAILTIDVAGVLAPERSAAAERWFPQLVAGRRIVDCIAAVDASFAEELELAHEAFVEDVMPREVCLAQLPSKLRAGDRHYRCSYLELPGSGLLVVIDDVTESVCRAEEDVVRQELLSVAQGLMSDRAGYLSFFEESSDLVEELLGSDLDRRSRARLLHTLKGNAAMVGANALAAQCHLAENELEDSDAISSPTLALVEARWQALVSAMNTILGSARVGVVEIAPSVIEELSARLRAGTPARVIASELDAWTLEPVERSLSRLARYAVPLAARLGKGTLTTSVQAADLRLEPKRWAPLWSVLVHVVRNAVDHGIETEEERALLGKTSAACLTLGARTEGGALVVEIADDGRGIDWRNVRARAQALGHPSASRDDLVRALLLPGVTTRAHVSNVSGRGIGMDAVGDAVDRLGGVIAVESEAGRGTTWRFTFPQVGLRPSLREAPRDATDAA